MSNDWEFDKLRHQLKIMEEELYRLRKQAQYNPYQTATQQTMAQHQLQNQIQQDMASLQNQARQYNQSNFGPSYKSMSPTAAFEGKMTDWDKPQVKTTPEPKTCKPIPSFERMLKLKK